MEDRLDFKFCNWSKLACKNCKYSVINGASSTSCVMYQCKPDKVFFEGKPCERFVRKVGR